MVTTAERIAREAHAGQVDKSGRPYVEHLARVAAAVASPDVKAVAWLHDVLEDTSVTVEALIDAGIDPEVVEAVMLLTRLKGETYAAYLRTIRRARNPLAAAVKVADLRDHLREETREAIPASLRLRYERALATFGG